MEKIGKSNLSVASQLKFGTIKSLESRYVNTWQNIPSPKIKFGISVTNIFDLHMF